MVAGGAVDRQQLEGNAQRDASTDVGGGGRRAQSFKGADNRGDYERKEKLLSRQTLTCVDQNRSLTQCQFLNHFFEYTMGCQVFREKLSLISFN